MKHAILSPSSAEKWSNCPASIQLERQAISENPGINGPNIYADTGTIAHAMGELCLTYGKSALEQFADIQENVQRYLDYIEDLRSPHSYQIIEEKVEIFDECYGTADCVIIDRDEMHVVDLKYGKGLVSAKENKQMMLYAYGFIKKHPKVKYITLHIVMPRGKNSSWEITNEDLLIRISEIKKKAEEAINPNNLETNPSDKACQWCKAIWICPEKDRSKDFDDLTID